MRAVVIEKPEIVVLKDVPEPVIGDKDVLIHPMAGGVCGTDVHIFEGDFLGEYPVIPCHELAGRVVDVGEGVEGLSIGDAIAVDPNIRCGHCAFCQRGEINLCEHYEAVGVTRPGGFAELVAVPSGNVHRMDTSDFSEGAFCEPLACVLYGQGRLRFPDKPKILIWGAGAIGLLHAHIAARLLDATITMVDIDPGRLSVAEAMGMDSVFLNDAQLNEKLNAIHPDGWDVAIDATGNTGAVEQMLGHLRRGGEALLFGVYPRGETLAVSPYAVFLNDWRLMGSFTYRDEFVEAVRTVNKELINSDKLVDLRIGLEEVPDVLKRIVKGEKMGKVHVCME